MLTSTSPYTKKPSISFSIASVFAGKLYFLTVKAYFFTIICSYWTMCITRSRFIRSISITTPQNINRTGSSRRTGLLRAGKLLGISRTSRTKPSVPFGCRQIIPHLRTSWYFCTFCVLRPYIANRHQSRSANTPKYFLFHLPLLTINKTNTNNYTA